MVEEQNCLHSKVQKVEANAAKVMACAAHLQKQLDFLEGRDHQILQSELKCLKLLDRTGAQAPESSSVASPSSFSDVLSDFD